MENPTLGEIRTRITNVYRRNKQTLTRTEKKLIEFPNQELKIEVAELQGFLRGLKKALDAVEAKANDNEFQFGEAP